MATEVKGLPCYYGCGAMEKVGTATFTCPKCNLKVLYRKGNWIRVQDK